MGGYGPKGFWSGIDREGSDENYASELANHRKYLTAEEAKLLFAVSNKAEITRHSSN